MKAIGQTGNGCLVHPDTRSLWWIQPEPEFHISWPRPSDSHPDVIDVVSDEDHDDDAADVDKLDDDNSIGESHKSFNSTKLARSLKNKSPCCSRDSLHLHHQQQHHQHHHHHHNRHQQHNNVQQQQQPIFRPICPTPPKKVRQTFPPLTRQNCVDVQISYPRVVHQMSDTKKPANERVLVSYPTFDCPNSFRPFSHAKVPYHALSPHSHCDKNICRRFDSLTSSSSSCCRRPDSSCSCRHEKRYRFQPVDPGPRDPVYDRVVSWLKSDSPKTCYKLVKTFTNLWILLTNWF